MTATELMKRLRALDVHVHAEGGRLRVSAPKGRMTPELEAALVASKDDLLRLLERGPASGAPVITALPRGDAGLPLSFAQERLWVLDQLQPESTAYNIAWSFAATTGVDIERLQRAIRRVVGRHEILRARFVLEAGGPVVRLATPDEVSIVVSDLRGMTEAEQKRLLDDANGEAVRVPFDLSSEPPVRFRILRTGEDRGSVLISAHHIALDAWSFGLLGRDMLSEYETLTTDDPGAPAPALQYADFAHWQRQLMEHPSAALHLAYWKERLAGLPLISVFPPDHARADEAGSRGATHDFTWSRELCDVARRHARDNDATLYMVLVAAVTAVLYRHTGQTDLAIGSPLGTRVSAELEGIIGPILNPIVLRMDVGDDPTFAQLIARAKEAVLEGHSHQEVPFERVVQELNPERSPGHSPLFQVSVVLHNAPDAAEVQITGGGAIYDLGVYAAERGGAVVGAYEYRADLYEAETIQRIASHVENVLTAAARDRTTPLSRLQVLDATERDLVVAGFNATALEVDRSTVVTQFARAMATRRDKVAVVGSDGTLSYGELDRLSSVIAARLATCGAGPGTFVALATDRTTALPAAALGILKSGAAYVPVDLSYPTERVAMMLRDSRAGQVVTTRSMAAALNAVGTTASIIVVDDLQEAPDEPIATPAGPSPDDIAYLMYTSGSTGTPKGVLVPHAAVSAFLGAMRERPGFTEHDVVLSVTSPSFDISVLELLLPLVQGGRVVVADRDTVSDGGRLTTLLDSCGATVFQSTPSGWRLLMNAGWKGNPALSAIAGGEPFPPALRDWLLPRTRAVWNGYGPTESTVYSTMALLSDGAPISIGTPVTNTRIYLLDAHLQPVPIGAPGEIFIAGDGVARGYHDRPDITAERFVPDVVSPGATMYRTGDIGRWRADGRIEHLGRIDGQVKVRGYRIETGEIEAVLEKHLAVRSAVVGVRAASADDPRIVAWVQLDDDEEVTVSELRRHLRQRLPEFMIPSMIMLVESFPLTGSGKVDHRALPDAFARGAPARADSPAPSTPTELLIAGVWTRLLNIDRVGTGESFFELGGHSLLAMRAATEIGTRIGHVLDPRLLFFRTLGQLAEACDALNAQPPYRRP